MNGEHATPGTLLVFVLVFVVVLTKIRSTRRDPGSVFVRRIAGVDAIDDAVGRAAETGRPTCFSTGITAVGPVLYACLGVLDYVTRKAAVFKSKLLVPQNSPEAMAVVEDAVREAYRKAGRSHLFDPTSVRFLSEEQFAFASGYQGLVHREKVGAAFLFGSFAAESLILAEAGQQVGAVQVAASVSPEQVAFFVCTCDYTLIGEELFAASAYLGKDPVQLASLAAQDRIKLGFLVVILLGVGVATFNSLFPHQALPQVDAFFTGAGDWFGLVADGPAAGGAGGDAAP